MVDPPWPAWRLPIRKRKQGSSKKEALLELTWPTARRCARTLTCTLSTFNKTVTAVRKKIASRFPVMQRHAISRSARPAEQPCAGLPGPAPPGRHLESARVSPKQRKAPRRRPDDGGPRASATVAASLECTGVVDDGGDTAPTHTHSFGPSVLGAAAPLPGLGESDATNTHFSASTRTARIPEGAVRGARTPAGRGALTAPAHLAVNPWRPTAPAPRAAILWAPSGPRRRDAAGASPRFPC